MKPDTTTHSVPLVEILGVHPLKSREPCHLIEVVLSGVDQPFDIADFTQPLFLRRRDSWQAPYMARLLTIDGRSAITDFFSASRKTPELLIGTVRLAFFFHYLKLRKALSTPFGAAPLPAPTPVPERLSFMCYEPVD